jgi:hypothetical protein
MQWLVAWRVEQSGTDERGSGRAGQRRTEQIAEHRMI